MTYLLCGKIRMAFGSMSVSLSTAKFSGEKEKEKEMKSTIKSHVALTRHSETGNTATSMTYTMGMPNMLTIEQKTTDGRSCKVDFTEAEIHVLQYIMSEFRTIARMTSEMDDLRDDEDRAIPPMSGVSLGRRY